VLIFTFIDLLRWIDARFQCVGTIVIITAPE